MNEYQVWLKARKVLGQEVGMEKAQELLAILAEHDIVPAERKGPIDYKLTDPEDIKGLAELLPLIGHPQ